MSASPKNFMQAIGRLAEDKQPFNLQMSKLTAWQLMSAIQLTCRHPKFKGPTRDTCERLARDIERILCANDNDLRQFAAMSWQEQFDETVP